jgi:signal peptidase I
MIPPMVAGLVASRGLGYRAFQLPSVGMSKSVLRGDYLAADTMAYGLRIPLSSFVLFERRPQRGDIVVFRYPKDRKLVFIQRVVGLPGEQVAVRGAGVYIDGRLLAETYAGFGGSLSTEPAPWPEPLAERLEDAVAGEGRARHYGPETVPAGHIFVLGDNRDHSLDSRYWGFVPLADVRGRAARVYFSRDPDTGRVRWERIGGALR